MAAISVATPWVSQRIFDKWFSFPNMVMLMPILATTFKLFLVIARNLKRLHERLAQGKDCGAAEPFVGTVGVFLLPFYGLSPSLFSWLVVDKLTIWNAASSPEVNWVIFYGVVVVLPTIIGYTVFAYRVLLGLEYGTPISISSEH